MRLTVGPLPAAVYWRRRAVVLVSLAMVVLVISYACGGPDRSTADAGGGAPSSPGSGSAAGASTTPTTPDSSPSPTPGASAFTLPTTGATGPCTDAEIRVTASAASSSVQIGQSVDLTITIRNTSSRACNRDVGADLQELRILDQGKIIWSSDDCGANKGRDVRSLTPSKELSFTLSWGVVRTRTGNDSVTCSGGAPVPRVYDVVARLDKIVSAPFALRVM